MSEINPAAIPQPLQAVLFDLDGTLADTAPDLTAALNHVLESEQRPTLPAEAVRPAAAFGSARLIQVGFGDNHPDEARLKTMLLNYYEAHIAVHTQLFDGMAEVLALLEQKAIPYAIVTNKPERFTFPLLKALQVTTPYVVCGDTTAKAKPDPLPLLTACNAIGCAPENCLYLGDSIVDASAAKAAQMPMLAAAYGYLQKDDTISDWGVAGQFNSPYELLDILGT